MIDSVYSILDARKAMKKRKKRMMENSAETNPKNEDLAAQIKAITDGLYYMSETDAEIFPFVGKPAESVSAAEISGQIGAGKDLPIEEKNFADFFAPLVGVEDWYGDEENATVRKFEALKSLLEKNLKDLKVFKIGKIQIDIYIVGLDARNILTGVQTKAVET